MRRLATHDTAKRAFWQIKPELQAAARAMTAHAAGLRAESETTVARFETVMLATSTAAFLLLLVGGVVLARSVARPIHALERRMRRLADGDLEADIPDTDARDEVGIMARTVLVFRDNARETERRRARQVEDQRRAEEEKRAALLAMAETVEREARNAVESIARQTERMTDNAVQMASSAAAVGSNSQGVAAAAAAQALSNAQTVAAASEQLTASIREIGTQIATATGITGEAVAASVHAEQTIRLLSDTVAHIGEVSHLINEIAGQTNLLARNVTQTSGAAQKVAARIADVSMFQEQFRRAVEGLSPLETPAPVAVAA